MAEQNGAGPEPWRLDLLAFPRKSSGIIRLNNDKGKPAEYPVFSVLDLKPDDAIQVLAIEDEIGQPGKSFREQLDLGVKQVLILVPDLPASVAASLTPNMLVKIRRKALGYDAANPQAAEAATATATPSADSSDSSPARPSSSAGPTGT